MTAAALLLAWAGFTALSLAMRRHRRLWRRTASGSVRTCLRAGGTLGLAAALGICVATTGWSIGFVLWTGVLTAAALMVVGQIQLVAARSLLRPSAPDVHANRRSTP